MKINISPLSLHHDTSLNAIFFLLLPSPYPLHHLMPFDIFSRVALTGFLGIYLLDRLESAGESMDHQFTLIPACVLNVQLQ
jgi:hypothetical protein